MSTTTIRLATGSDGAAAQAIYGPYVRDTAISFEYDPPTAEEMTRRIEATATRYPYLVVECDGDVRGYAYASELRGRRAYDWSVETTVYLRNDCLGHGYGRALYESLIPVLRLLGYHQAYAAISLPNAASVALHERVGFTHAGTYDHVGWKFGEWRPVGWWQLMLDEPAGEPSPPTPINEYADTDALAAALASGLPFVTPR